MKDEFREQETGDREQNSRIPNTEHPTPPLSLILHPSSFPNIGSAREDEFDTVLEVMCAAFELPYQVARPVLLCRSRTLMRKTSGFCG